MVVLALHLPLNDHVKLGCSARHRDHVDWNEEDAPLCHASVLSYKYISDTMALTSNRLGIRFDFQYLVTVRCAA